MNRTARPDLSSDTRLRPLRRLALILTLLVAVAAPPGGVAAQDGGRVGADLDPVVGAVQLSQAAHADGQASHAVVGRHDVFADNLAATPLAGRFGTLLFTTGGGDAEPRPEMLAELRRALGPRTCQPGGPADVYLAGGVAAISDAVAGAVADAGYCVQRLGGEDRIATAIVLADQVGGPGDRLVLARADDWADAAAIGSWAARTNTRILVTPTGSLDPRVADAIRRYAPTEVLLMGGTAALSDAVAEQVGDIAPVRRIAGATRDETAAAIAEEVWAETASGRYAVAHGYAGTAWAYLFAAAPLTGRDEQPWLYADDDGPTDASQQVIDTTGAEVRLVGPPVPLDVPPTASPTDPGPPGDPTAARVGLTEVGAFDRPLVLRARPGVGELWVAERAGVVRALGPSGVRTVLDISSTVSATGERGLLGMDFSDDGLTLFTSSTDRGGDSVIDAFAIADDVVDAASRRELIRVDQPASNHNGGDLHVGPDGMLWWSLGDGGGSNDRFGNGQRPDTLLGTIVRIDPTGDPYGIPPDNPFADGVGGAPEVWAYGLRNPFRFSFDGPTGDLWIGDVGQNAIEEVDMVPAGTGAGSNFGWPIWEGTRRFRQGTAPGHVPPVWETTHAAGSCSITGGVVYRGTAIPELYGAYLYSDFCDDELRAIVVEDGQVVADADLGVSVRAPVGFGVDHDGEVYVLSLNGPVVKLTPG